MKRGIDLLAYLYNIALTMGVVAGAPWIASYLLLTPKRRRSLPRKLGFGLPKAHGSKNTKTKTIWIHTLSVGETLSALPLVAAVIERYPTHPLYVSVSTETGLEAARKAMKALPVTLFTSPFDFPPFAIRRLFTILNPAAVMVVESDLWPNFLSEANRQQVPVLLANARVSDRSFARYRRVRPVARALFSGLGAIGSQSRLDLERLVTLGVPESKIRVTGNIKFDQPAPSMTTEAFIDLRGQMSIPDGTSTIVAGSTHPGEEALIAETAKRLVDEGFTLKVVSVPRNPDRASEVCRLFADQGFRTARYSDIETRSADPDSSKVIVVDRIGLLRELYGIADLAIVGGSLIETPNLGGHNPLEPAAFGKPVIVGPNMKNFKAISAQLLEAGGMIQVKDSDTRELTHIVKDLLTNPDRAKETGDKALRVFANNRGAVERTLDILSQLMESA